MKKIMGILLPLVMVLLLLSACGIPQEEHDAILAERDAAQAEVTSLQSDLNKAQGQVGSLQSDLTKAESQVETLESDLTKAQSQVESLQSKVTAAEGQYTTFKSDLNTLWTSLHKKLVVWAYITDYWNGAAWLAAGGISMEEFTDFCTSFMANMGTYVDAVGNPELSQLWQDVFSYAAQGKEAEMVGSLAALTDLLGDLVGADIKAIEAKLSK